MAAIQSLVGRLFQPPPSQQLVSWLFIKLLALIYLAAFASLTGQIAGLAGPEGIMPLGQQFDDSSQEIGNWAWLWFPSIFWVIEPSDMALQVTAWLGVLLSIILFFGIWQRAMLIGAFLLYLSLYHAGQFFTNFQWDTLLLESGFLAIFLVGGPNLLLVFLFEWLLFRLRFMSGYFKLASGDPSWSGFTALNYYFETQPLPHMGSWYFQLLPEWMLKSGVGLTLFSELIVPFFIFLPRPFRIAAAAITILMQLLIISNSNHNFINLLTIALCVFLLDDRLLSRILPQRLQPKGLSEAPPKPSRSKNILVGLIALAIVPASLITFTANVLHRSLPLPFHQFSDSVRRLGLGNIYHVYPTMQVDRYELDIQGSNDGIDWLSYEFKYKPGPLDRAPPFNVPHQPRLDWLIWFVPTQQMAHMYWFDLFMQRLHQGSPQVLDLLAKNPFPDQPPNYLRVLVYQYHFTTPEQRAETGNWWRREYLGTFPQVEPRKP
ncbi:MAG: lipase maturation factor family protein [Chromatiales bacterium]|jgi:hypothetical protein